MKNSKQTLRIGLEVNSMPYPGEPIAEFRADYSGHSVVQVYEVYDEDIAEELEELEEELDHIQTPDGVAQDVLFRFKADDVDVTYDSSCHFLCRGTKCLVPSMPAGACPAATH